MVMQVYIEVDRFGEDLVRDPQKSLPELLVTINGLFSKLEASISYFHAVHQVNFLSYNLFLWDFPYCSCHSFCYVSFPFLSLLNFQLYSSLHTNREKCILLWIIYRIFCN